MKLFEKDELLWHAYLLMTKDVFSNEDAARANALMDPPGRIGTDGAALNKTQAPTASPKAKDIFATLQRAVKR